MRLSRLHYERKMGACLMAITPGGQVGDGAARYVRKATALTYPDDRSEGYRGGPYMSALLNPETVGPVPQFDPKQGRQSNRVQVVPPRACCQVARGVVRGAGGPRAGATASRCRLSNSRSNSGGVSRAAFGSALPRVRHDMGGREVAAAPYRPRSRDGRRARPAVPPLQYGSGATRRRSGANSAIADLQTGAGW